MNVQVSDDAERDLKNGIAFYSQHGIHVGAYFRDSILADLQSLSIFGGVHSNRFGYHCMSAIRVGSGLIFGFRLCEASSS